ncbi:hypothetical protein ACFQZV_09585 [Microbacterium koreense]|uniref:Lipoprotein n=1 Tax=Microbacterium koreense TaxID=323761 RepID=A0ABW2ZSG8_9MICO
MHEQNRTQRRHTAGLWAVAAVLAGAMAGCSGAPASSDPVGVTDDEAGVSEDAQTDSDAGDEMAGEVHATLVLNGATYEFMETDASMSGCLGFGPMLTGFLETADGSTLIFSFVDPDGDTGGAEVDPPYVALETVEGDVWAAGDVITSYGAIDPAAVPVELVPTDRVVAGTLVLGRLEDDMSQTPVETTSADIDLRC